MIWDSSVYISQYESLRERTHTFNAHAGPKLVFESFDINLLCYTCILHVLWSEPSALSDEIRAKGVGLRTWYVCGLGAERELCRRWREVVACVCKVVVIVHKTTSERKGVIVEEVGIVVALHCAIFASSSLLIRPIGPESFVDFAINRFLFSCQFLWSFLKSAGANAGFRLQEKSQQVLRVEMLVVWE